MDSDTDVGDTASPGPDRERQEEFEDLEDEFEGDGREADRRPQP